MREINMSKFNGFYITLKLNKWEPNAGFKRGSLEIMNLF